MSENPSEIPTSGGDELRPATDPAQAAPPAPPTGPPTSPPTGPAAPVPRLRERVFRFRSVIAVAAAGVIVGGAAGAGITALTDGHGERRPSFGRNGFGPGRAPGMSGGLPGMPGGPGLQQLPGQQAPGLPGQPQGQSS